MRESPTRQLADEHDYVLLVVGAMEAEADRIEASGVVDAERVGQMVDFTRNFTDGDHHTKEENLLFPLLEERSPAAGGTISVLLSEHEAARDCIRAISAALPGAGGEDEERAAAGRAVIVEAPGHAYLLPLHIGRQDTVPLKFTDELLSPGSRRSWRGSSRTWARRRERRPSQSATTAWRTTSPGDPPADPLVEEDRITGRRTEVARAGQTPWYAATGRHTVSGQPVILVVYDDMSSLTITEAGAAQALRP